MKVKDIKSEYQGELASIYERSELDEITSLAFEAVKGFSKTDMTIRMDEKVTAEEAYKLGKILSGLKQNKPIQQILGYAWFYGMKFIVNENVLIPRPETEELVQWIIHEVTDHRAPVSILDIGTGSGCIAIALKKNIEDAKVFALDISDKALAVATKNAELNHTQIQFTHSDILSIPTPNSQLPSHLDILVSNPPYLLHSDKSTLQERVLDHEPHLALFAGEDDLIYYKAIADFACNNLTKEGMLFFEIHEKKGEELKQLLEAKEFKNVQLRKDLSGKDRMIKASLK
jgi:release factor glutamine methyltransferase